MSSGQQSYQHAGKANDNGDGKDRILAGRFEEAVYVGDVADPVRAVFGGPVAAQAGQSGRAGDA
jgi:hypothetical protein